MAREKTPKPSKTPTKSVRKAKAATNGNGHSSPIDLEAEIRFRAYELYQRRAGMDGGEADDWLMAEKEVKAKHAVAGA
jgi:hypothetical protein